MENRCKIVTKIRRESSPVSVRSHADHCPSYKESSESFKHFPISSVLEVKADCM